MVIVLLHYSFKMYLNFRFVALIRHDFSCSGETVSAMTWEFFTPTLSNLTLGCTRLQSATQGSLIFDGRSFNVSICFALINFRVLANCQENLQQGDLDTLYFILNGYNVDAFCRMGNLVN